MIKKEAITAEDTKRGQSCSFCGNNWHSQIKECPARKIQCRNCGLQGHFAKCCRRRQQKNSKFSVNKRSVNITETNFIKSQFETVYINKHPVKFMLDTGATVSLIPEKIFEALN